MPGLTKETVRRVEAATRRVEEYKRNDVPRGAGAVPTEYKKVGKVTTAITARSGDTPGQGYAQPYRYHAETNSLAPIADAPEMILNWTGSVVAVNTPIKYVEMYGYLWYDGNDCSGVALP